jgi:hypothetical protein
MHHIFRIIFILLACFTLFHFVFLEKALAPRIDTNSSTSGVILTGVTEKICIKNPHIEFFMYHYIRDHDPKDTLFTKELSVPPAVFEEHMRKIKSLAKQKRVTLMP